MAVAAPGRFVLVPRDAWDDADERELASRLDALGLFSSTPDGAPREQAVHHVFAVPRDPGAAAEAASSWLASLPRAGSRGVTVALAFADEASADTVAAVLGLLAERSGSRPLAPSVDVPAGAVDERVVGVLLQLGGTLRMHFSAPRVAGALDPLQVAHREHARRGVPPELAYVTAAFPLGPTVREDVRALAEAGAVFVHATAPRAVSPDLPSWVDALLTEVLLHQTTDRLLVERGIALHVEAFAARAAERLVVVSPSEPRLEVPGSLPPGCGGCVYAAACGSALLRRGTFELAAWERAPSSAPCASTMAVLDAVFSRVADGRGDALRRALARWADARRAVERRFAGS